jgi:sugar phosphate isomerase/epimerase
MYKIIAFCKWCQGLPLPELAAHLKKVGVDGVDLPCRPGAPIGPAEAPTKLPEARRVFEDHGLALERIVTGIEEANEESDRQLAAIRAVGVKKIRLEGYSPKPGQAGDARRLLDEARRKLAGVEKLLKKHGVKGAIQNHSGMTLDVNVSSCLLMMQDCDPEWVGVQCDPGHLTLSGEPFELALGLLGPYLHSVNLKSPRQEYFANPKTGGLSFQPIWVPLRDGMVDVPAVLKALKAVGYTEPISIHGEYRTHYSYIVDNLEETGKLIAGDVAYLRATMARYL